MEEAVKKFYLFELLYDNGAVEIFPSGESTEEELLEFVNIVYRAFQNGANGVLQLPGTMDGSALINVGKVTRLSWKEAPENN